MQRPESAMPAVAIPATSVKLAALLAAMLGLAVVFTVGFAHPMAIHNAAHDSRHAFAFPCH